jgi:hypothetical protein
VPVSSVSFATVPAAHPGLQRLERNPEHPQTLRHLPPKPAAEGRTVLQLAPFSRIE